LDSQQGHVYPQIKIKTLFKVQLCRGKWLWLVTLFNKTGEELQKQNKFPTSSFLNSQLSCFLIKVERSVSELIQDNGQKKGAALSGS
jgi:hypothetical protein